MVCQATNRRAGTARGPESGGPRADPGALAWNANGTNHCPFTVPMELCVFNVLRTRRERNQRQHWFQRQRT